MNKLTLNEPAIAVGSFTLGELSLDSGHLPAPTTLEALRSIVLCSPLTTSTTSWSKKALQKPHFTWLNKIIFTKMFTTLAKCVVVYDTVRPDYQLLETTKFKVRL